MTGPPPWNLSAESARDLVNRPLRLVLENNESDRLFVQSTVPSFSAWCARDWIIPEMGGGAAMESEIRRISADAVGRWRTFFLFDSDRLHPAEFDEGWTPPNGDGCQGHNFEMACAAIPSERWHRLERRSIENYLPLSVLSPIEPTATTALFSAAVGRMACFYNMKKGLTGDGVSPPNPSKTVRAARSQGFWTSLTAADVQALEAGFGRHVIEEFNNVPAAQPWPADIIAEMNALADALQDAM